MMCRPETNGAIHMSPITVSCVLKRLGSQSESQEPWGSTRIKRRPVGRATEPLSSFDSIVEQLSTMLENRLAEVIFSRQHDCCGGGDNRDTATAMTGFAAPPESAVLLSPSCRSQIRRYVRRIGNMYRDVRYHKFEHAAHVTASANRLLDMLDERDLDLDLPDPAECADSISLPSLSRSSMTSASSYTDLSLLSGAAAPGAANCSAACSASSVSTAASVASSASTTFGMQDCPPPTSSVPRRKSYTSTTYNVSKDSLAKFALVFAALVHDVDHQGVPNRQLISENDPLADLYNGKSVAENHSVKVAFEILMDGTGLYEEFHKAIMPTPEDTFRLRRLVTDLVISTDISSPERMKVTKSRWEDAFCSSSSSANSRKSFDIATVTASRPRIVTVRRTSIHGYPTITPLPEQIDSTTGVKRALHLNGQDVDFYTTGDGKEYQEMLRASVVLETMINAADVAHALQSWETFLEWNTNLFAELFEAFKQGRGGDNDPAVGWYGNQITFYDVYILPLARKLKTCGVFGKEGHVFESNAQAIRDRWVREGAEVSRVMIESVTSRYHERCMPSTAAAALCHTEPIALDTSI